MIDEVGNIRAPLSPITFDEISTRMNEAFDRLERLDIEMAQELEAWRERLDRT